jgi:photosystem II stability/assembly factor-like uncharacterized protein
MRRTLPICLFFSIIVLSAAVTPPSDIDCRDAVNRRWETSPALCIRHSPILKYVDSLQERQYDISGTWRSNIGLVYQINQEGDSFTWNVESIRQRGEGTIAGGELNATWQGRSGRESGRGRVTAADQNGRATRLEWSNGVVFTREGGAEPQPSGEAQPHRQEFPDLSGMWYSNFGHRLEIGHNGNKFTIHVMGVDQQFPGFIEGDSLQADWMQEGEKLTLHGGIAGKDNAGRALIIEWSNGMVFSREPFPEQPERESEHAIRERERLEREQLEQQREQPVVEREQPREEFIEQPGRERGIIDISGVWTSSIRRTYEIEQSRNDFSWRVRGTDEEAEGRIEGEALHVSWGGEFGRGSVEGRIVEVDPEGRALSIEWFNGVIFNRQPADEIEQGRFEEARPGQIQRLETRPEVAVPDLKTEMMDRVRHFALKKVYNEWVKVGGPIGGLGYDVRYIANNARGRNVIFVTDNYSGVNMSVDGGENWFASNSGITGRSGDSGDAVPVFSLTVDPNNPNIVWAGLKDVKGVYKSTDAGKTWKECTPSIPENEFVFRGFSIVPGNSDVVYAAGELPTQYDGIAFNKVKGRVYLTEDGGKSWEKIWEGDDLCRYIMINPQNPNIIHVSCGIFDREAFNSNCGSPTILAEDLPKSFKDRGGVGILRSFTGGKAPRGGNAWEVLDRKNGLEDLYVGSLVMHPTNPNILMAGAGNNPASPYRVESKTHYTGGVFITTDGGDHWKKTLGDDIITAVEFAPSNPNIAYAGSQRGFYRSEDGGYIWEKVAGQNYPWGPPGVIAGFPIDILVDPVDPNILFANNYGGGNVKSTDGGKNWTLASQGYTGALMFDVAIHPSNSDIVYAGARSGLFRTLNAGAKWEGLSYPPAVLAECYAVGLHPKNPQIVIASRELLGDVYRSLDGGKAWQQVLKLPAITGDPLETYGFKRIVFAPSDPNVVYAATCRGSNQLSKKKSAFGVYKSTQAGAQNTWVPANDAQMQNQAVNDIAVHPKNHNVVYAATAAGGLFKTTNGGTNWTAVPTLKNKDVRSVAIDPTNPKIVYAGLDVGGVYFSNDDGNTWYKMAAGMDPNDSVWALAVDPINPKAVWAGTRRSGVLRWDSIEQQWVRVNKGLSTKAIADLEISLDGKVLYVSTTGEGVFRYDKQP